MIDHAEMLDWLAQHCPLKVEYDFWFQFYDDLNLCFDGLEPWRIWTGSVRGEDPTVQFWRTFDRKFTGRLIPADEATQCPPK